MSSPSTPTGPRAWMRLVETPTWLGLGLGLGLGLDPHPHLNPNPNQGFHCPPSYVLGPKKANEVFPQLDEKVKYCAVLHEGQHNDARTCTSIALTAALKGATIANHVEVRTALQG